MGLGGGHSSKRLPSHFSFIPAPWEVSGRRSPEQILRPSLRGKKGGAREGGGVGGEPLADFPGGERGRDVP